jgi:hypothetical protein
MRLLHFQLLAYALLVAGVARGLWLVLGPIQTVLAGVQ